MANSQMDNQAYLKKIDETIANGPFQDNWESLSKFQVPDWYPKAKFGIFIHWGLYSVPAFSSEWYSRNMYIQDSKEYEHHIATYGEHKNFGYKDFIPMFKAEKFDADEWAELFRDAGARYIMPVAEHHDGFQMYKSEVSRFNAYEMGPQRDLVGEMKVAFEKQGLELTPTGQNTGSSCPMAKRSIPILRSRLSVEISIGLRCRSRNFRICTVHLLLRSIWKTG
jgi:alpha-L-fucosidase